MNKGKSFMYREKGSGPNTQPCGTPYFTEKKYDLIVFIQTSCSRFDKEIQCRASLDNP